MATLQFINNGLDRNHDFYIPGADNGPSNTNEFAWGTLNILGQTVHLFDGNTGNTGTAPPCPCPLPSSSWARACWAWASWAGAGNG